MYLNEQEIVDFVSRIDKDDNGRVSLATLEQALEQSCHKLNLDTSNDNPQETAGPDEERREFLQRMLGTEENAIPVQTVKDAVARWKIPSLQPDEHREIDHLKKISWWRKFRALWQVYGPEWVFLLVIVFIQVNVAVWQCVKYTTGQQFQAAFGWGISLGKLCAGMIYPTLFFMLLSMSRWFSTFIRRFHYISRYINADRSRLCHIYTAYATLVLAILHSIAHLGGTFIDGSRPDRRAAVEVFFGPTAPHTYLGWLAQLAGWTGVAALCFFCLIALLSIPLIRKYSYELFQLTHLLMWPLIIMLMAHGSDRLRQYPALGIVMTIPVVLILTERLTRTLRAFCRTPARVHRLDEKTIILSCTIPQRKYWPFQAGQYVFINIPQLSYFQWHPFTIVSWDDGELQLCIKTDGDWTGKIPLDLKYVAIDGPYGAPAQRFYEFNHTIIIGSGIGITPYAGILNDLQKRIDRVYPSRKRPRSPENVFNKMRLFHGKHESVTTVIEKEIEKTDDTSRASTPEFGDLKSPTISAYRRTDLHWMVRDKNNISWFSALLNKISEGDHSPNFDIRIHPYVMQNFEKDLLLNDHVFDCLVERYRGNSQPVSPLTGLIAPTHLGRPSFSDILHEHYEDLLELHGKNKTKSRERTVGVFFCGAPALGVQLADLCRQMTLRGQDEGSGIKYDFRTEIFG